MSIDENVQKNECSCNTENGKKMMEMLETERKRIVSEIHVSSAIGRGTTIDIKIPLDLHSAVKKNS